MITPEDIKRDIEIAFGSSEYPASVNIIKESEHYEVNDMKDAFQQKRWQDISVKTAYDFRISTVLFTPEGFRYFLPSFLMAVLDEDTDIGDIDNYIILDLIPPDNNRDQFSRVMSGFTEIQKKAIAKFVKWFFDDNPLYDNLKKKVAYEFWNIDI